MLTPIISPELIALRSAAEVCSPADLGGARSTRHSFTRQLIRELSGGDWAFSRTVFDLDELGRGTAAYEVTAPGDTVMTLVLFSQIIGEASRTDRVIAEAWDVTGALVGGSLTTADIDGLRPQVTVQEEGRAIPGTIIWGRANRSVRFFTRVVEDLAAGRQPHPDDFGLSPYLLRSTAFYSNGKFGMRDFESYPEGHVFAVPYRAHMLAAWLFREFSYELAEHCARAINPDAPRLTGDWASYFGLGNATGLGLVPYVVNHPEILDAWLWSREYPLAVAVAREDLPESREAALVASTLDHLGEYLTEQGDEIPAPYSSGTEIAAALAPIRALAHEYVKEGTMGGEPTRAPWRTLHEAATAIGPEVRGVVASAIVELTDDLDNEVVAALVCEEDRSADPGWTVGRLRTAIDTEYGWIDAFDFTDGVELDRFWFTSESSEEPRRGTTDTDPGVRVQHGVNIAEEIAALRAALDGIDSDQTVAEFLLAVPGARAAVARVQKVGPLRYGELRANLRSSAFLPLDAQRVQLAVYGMENYQPQSTDWLRVTLLSGAPRLADIMAGRANDAWMFPLRPRSGAAA